MVKTIFVSGATGFIAQHIVQQLLQLGYIVIGSVRSKGKGEDLQKLINSPNFSYVVIPNLVVAGAFDEALKAHPEIKVFIHTASPVDFEATDFKNEVLDPAIEGTKNVLSAIKTFGTNIETLVYTSSVIAIIDILVKLPRPIQYNEDSWNPITYEESFKDPYTAYGGSKTFAERAVWDFVKNEKPKFTVTTIHPTYVLGPQAYEVKNKTQLNFSADISGKLLNLKPSDEIPEFFGDYIDVRDTAKAHIFAFEHPEKSNGERFLLRDCYFTNDSLVELIRKNFPQLQLPKGDLEKSAQLIEEKALRLDPSKTNSILQFKYIPLEQSIIDSVQQILEC
ncbi:hypothetical protein KGF56_000770 [Candida oxycetoniae]|uniref:3-beta hydroxysteroid dehydrogenase/isomerase domain-containing protein n=1 Tax=Candida oxycetoniae TaxID=497107 RepID=A0AAI9T0P3_9ASCO|nr:uncharacterized protein KGF56_000770 [Candida oxycetoniae]KAI3406290.2 hypothetical protein KGF56_000770 [Candida oxycetoniae]